MISADLTLSFTLATDSVATLNFSADVVTGCATGTIWLGLGVDTSSIASVSQQIAVNNAVTHVS